MKNARAGRAELLFLLIGAIVLWRSRSSGCRPYVSSLVFALSGRLGKILLKGDQT